MTLPERLAERCEKATGPDRELDELAHLAAGYRLVDPEADERLQGIKRWARPDGVRTGWVHNRDHYDYPPAYTASLDAAMRLIPGDDWEWSLERETGSLLWHPDATMFSRAKFGDPMLRMEAEALTPALALCAAALRARSQTPGGEGE